MADRVDRVRPTGMRNDGGIRPVAKRMAITAQIKLQPGGIIRTSREAPDNNLWIFFYGRIPGYSATGVNSKVWPPTDASYISPPRARVQTATPFE